MARPHLLPAALALGTASHVAPVAPLASQSAIAGFLKIDLLPPRTRA